MHAVLAAPTAGQVCAQPCLTYPPPRAVVTRQQGRGEASGGAQDEGDGDEENYDGTQGGTQTQRQKGGARGKAAGAKRAKKAGAAPLAEANAMVD